MRENGYHIKSSSLSLKEANVGKLNDVKLFIEEYKRVCQTFVDVLWNEEKISRFIPKEITSNLETWLSKRSVQCAAKQASGIVRGTRKKNEQRLYKYNEFISQGMFKKARKLKKIIDRYTTSKPELKSINPELDSRFVRIIFENKTVFDSSVQLSSLGNQLKIILPVKKNHTGLILLSLISWKVIVLNMVSM